MNKKVDKTKTILESGNQENISKLSKKESEKQ